MKFFIKRSGAFIALCLIALATVAQDGAKPTLPRPCENLPEFHQFDFWVGTWDVHMQDGRQVGVNTITTEQGRGRNACYRVKSAAQTHILASGAEWSLFTRLDVVR